MGHNYEERSRHAWVCKPNACWSDDGLAEEDGASSAGSMPELLDDDAAGSGATPDDGLAEEDVDVNASMKIALVPVSAKPYHVGHHVLVTKAAAASASAAGPRC